MARMFPERLPHDVQSEAERRVFDAFHDQFSDDWVVFSQVRWLSVTPSSRASDGEADFIVVHPRYGVLVLEVKGGGIAFDAATRKYTSTDASGRVHKIKDPFNQASRSKFALLDKLYQSPLTSRFQYKVEHAVALPDVFVDGDLALDAPREIVIDLARIPNLKQAIVDAFRYYGGERQSMAAIAVEALVELLGSSWQIETTIGTGIAQQEHVVRLLTEEQFGVLDVLRSQRRALISGCAGSGKTMLAIEKAKRLARQGQRVLLTCFNQNLASWLTGAVEGEGGITTCTFLSLCKKYADDAGLPLQRERDETDQAFFARFPEVLLQALDKLPDRFDAIIVDEAQDFEEEWWIAIEALLADPEKGILYIFFDDNQRLYRREAAFPVGIPPFHLSRNCRNTKRIHEAVVMFYQSDVVPECLNADGRDPHLLTIDGPERAGIERFITELVTREKVGPGQIAVLTRRSRERSAWKAPPAQSEWASTWDLADSADKVIVSTVHAFKGLERPVVIVCELQGVDLEEQKELLYVAFSRAREYLVVVGLDAVTLAS